MSLPKVYFEDHSKYGTSYIYPDGLTLDLHNRSNKVITNKLADSSKKIYFEFEVLYLDGYVGNSLYVGFIRDDISIQIYDYFPYTNNINSIITNDYPSYQYKVGVYSVYIDYESKRFRIESDSEVVVDKPFNFESGRMVFGGGNTSSYSANKIIATVKFNFGESPFQREKPKGYSSYSQREIKALIKKDNEYGYYKERFYPLGKDYPTKEQFEEFGMEDLSILEPVDKQFDYEMELINQTDEEKLFSYTFDLNGQHKNMKSIDGIITE